MGFSNKPAFELFIPRINVLMNVSRDHISWKNSRNIFVSFMLSYYNPQVLII